MKLKSKLLILVVFFLFSISAFTETVFMPHVGIIYGGSEVIPSSKYIPTYGLDMQFISHKNGFTLFFNNTVSYKNKDFILYAPELLIGGTFRREKGLNVSFGLGIRALSTIKSLSYLSGIQKKANIAQSPVFIIPSFGATLGISYYFNNVIGFSFFISDFMAYGTYTLKEEGTKKLTFSKGFSDNLIFKFGINLRINGQKEGH